MIIGTLFIKALWTLHPDVLLGIQNIQTHQMFPFAKHVWITKPTYISMICDKSISLIIVWTWLALMPEYKKPLSALFIIHSLQFVEFFFTYNETLIWMNIGRHKLDIDLSLLKLIVPVGILIFQEPWKDKS